MASKLEFLRHKFRLKAAPKLSRFLVDTVALDACYSVDKAKQDFACHSLVSPKEGLDRTLHYYNEKI